MATIKTIARMAGVSTSTVSIILNGKAKERKISSATEKEVLAIAASIGYRHNALQTVPFIIRLLFSG